MKKITSLFLSLLIVLSLGTTAFAADKENKSTYYDNVVEVEVDPNTTVTVVIPNNVISDVDDSNIAELLSSTKLENGDVITIMEVGLATPPSDVSYVGSLAPNAPKGLFDYVVTSRTYGSEYQAQNYFVISAAKGQTTTLSSKFSVTISTNFSVGDDAYIEADIGGSVTAEYSTQHQFVGPPESSNYNSREFRVQFYARRVDWVQRKYNLSDELIGIRTGTAYAPTKYLLYSIDHIL